MEKIFIDFETRSDLDIAFGKKRYLNTPSSAIVCLGYRVDYTGKTRIWVPGHGYLYWMFEPEKYQFYAFNIQFDRDVWNTLGQWKTFLPLENCVDIMALCGRYGLPQSLSKAGEALGTVHQKNPRGKALMEKICMPPFKYTQDEYFEFLDYCRTDVDTMVDILNTFPVDELSTEEQATWVLSCKMNENGLPVDLDSVKQISEVASQYLLSQNERLPDITDNVVTKITQATRIKNWINSKGVDIPNLTKETVAEYLDYELPENVQTVLELRAAVGLSSVAKYRRLVDLTFDGRIYDNMRYYGTHTGRWAGLGFQLFNLPRAKVEDPEKEIAKFHDLSIIEENPVKSARALIRSMICAPEGRMICAADYESIENILLLWAAGDADGVQEFRDGKSQYVSMASFLYGLPYDEILEGHKAKDKKYSDMRFEGKVIVLGCGYGLGATGFIRVAKTWGLNITKEQSQRAVNGFRDKYPLIPKFWYALKDCAVMAIKQPGRAFMYRNCTFKVIKDRNGLSWLKLTLPSGRALIFKSPSLKSDAYGLIPCHEGINPYSKAWCTRMMTPGRIAENVIQALARDILVHGKKQLQAAGYMLIGSIYDEVIAEIDDRDHEQQLEHFESLMCSTEEWSKDIPLRAEGFVGKRYKKM